MMRWLFRRYVAAQVRQGYDHPQRITALYQEIAQAAEREFYEDNVMTLSTQLREWFEAAFNPTQRQIMELWSGSGN
jgi:hypothetical protein